MEKDKEPKPAEDQPIPEIQIPEEPEEEAITDNIEKLILDTSMNKYDAILMARRWVYEIKAKAQRSHSVQYLISKSVGDILSGRVDAKTVKNLPPVSVLKKQKESPAAALFENIDKIAAEAEKAEKAEKSVKAEKSESKKKDKEKEK